MTAHLLFWSISNTLIGTMEVPPCFSPNDDLHEAANDLGVRIGRSSWGVPAGLEVAGGKIFDEIALHARNLKAQATMQARALEA